MCNTNYNVTDYEAGIPLTEDDEFTSAFTEEDIDQIDLQLIDSFAGLQKNDQSKVLDMVKHLLKDEVKPTIE